MNLSMYHSSVSVFIRMLNNLNAILDKAIAHAHTRNIDPQVFLNARLYPDMFPFKRQVQIASDNAKGCGARLAGQTPPRYDDNEESFAELKARLQKTIDYLKTLKPEQFTGAEDKNIQLKIGSTELNFTGMDYLLNFALPNFYFHLAIAYGILRHNGVELGKRDYLENT